MYVDGKFGAEEIKDVYCKSHYPIINSHHDVIVSAFNLPMIPVEAPTTKFKATTVPNEIKRIIWAEESLSDYCALVATNLTDLRDRWSLPSSRSCVSMLLQLTSEIHQFQDQSKVL